MVIVPREIFFTRGVGRHKERLSSFELALRDAGVDGYNLAHYTLVGISSILPPQCRIVGRKTGLKRLVSGEVVFVVMARQDTNENRRLIASSIGVAIPADRNNVGYLSEHHGYGQTGKRAGDYAEDLAAGMLATSLGIDFDPDASWSERESKPIKYQDKLLPPEILPNQREVRIGYGQAFLQQLLLHLMMSNKLINPIFLEKNL